MPRGGSRVGAGRPKGPQKRTPTLPSQAAVETISLEIPVGKETPLRYMLRVMNDPDVDPQRRDRIAVALAPYLHPKLSDAGKKESKHVAADVAATGRFRAASPPKLALVNKPPQKP